MVAHTSKDLQEEFAASGASPFPGSIQVQGRRWTVMSHLANDAAKGARWDDPFGSFYFTTIHHTDFDPDWPILTDWRAVVRGLRGTLHLSQQGFADLCGLGRATVERWETNRAVPFGGNALQLLTIVRPSLTTPVQAGQALNLAAAAVLPHLTRPTARYLGQEIASWLRRDKHDHRDLTHALLEALVTARILVPVGLDDDELEKRLYLPLPGQLRRPVDQPSWADGLVSDLQEATDDDRQLVIDLAHRFATGHRRLRA